MDRTPQVLKMTDRFHEFAAAVAARLVGADTDTIPPGFILPSGQSAAECEQFLVDLCARTFRIWCWVRALQER